MTNQSKRDFISNLPAKVKASKLTIDGEAISMAEFLKWNLVAADVDHISIEDAQKVIDMKVGESMYIHICKIKKVA